MMYFLESFSHDPRFNLALEQYLFDRLDRRHSYFLLWQNANTIVVGKHQNTMAEINAAYVSRHQVQVVRRLSGGGAVYHDLGNVNYTFITDASGSGYDFSTFCGPVVEILRLLGVSAQVNGRNDITIGEQKCSGSAQYRREGRVMHHGTLLFDSDLDAVGQALAVPPDKISSKGLPSVRSRVTNVRPHLARDMDTPSFLAALRESFGRAMTPFALTERDLAQVKEIQAQVYDRWEWNYGASPPCRICKARRVEGCGRLEVHLDVDRGGTLSALAFYGDYFGDGDSAELAQRLVGIPLEENALRAALDGVDLERYFHRMDRDSFLSILLS